MNFTPFPIIETNRLQLRQLKNSDASILFFLRTDKEVNKFIERPKTENIEEALKFISTINKGVLENNWIYWCITLKDKPNVIGTIGLRNFMNNNTIAEVGYELLSGFQKKGIMREALNEVLNYGFNTLKLKEIEAFTHRNNVASKKLLVNNKFIYNKHRIDKDNLDNHIFIVQNPNN